MLRSSAWLVAMFFVAVPALAAQDEGRDPGGDPVDGAKLAVAVRVPEGTIQVDGGLDDEAWAL
ncbi:MAG: hypothetical protein EXR92_05820, partial [Gemmatimonadetes bacterium]|nr:hypothetical protein [Gemmatimonadota bacterium]